MINPAVIKTTRGMEGVAHSPLDSGAQKLSNDGEKLNFRLPSFVCISMGPQNLCLSGFFIFVPKNNAMAFRTV